MYGGGAIGESEMEDKQSLAILLPLCIRQEFDFVSVY